MDTSLKTEITIPLSCPVTVKGADGKEAARVQLVMKRPKTRHAKRLAVAIGPGILKSFLADDDKVSQDQLADHVIEALMRADRLDELTGIVADLCGEPLDVIDDIDVIDLPAIGKAIIGFFPALQSLALSNFVPK